MADERMTAAHLDLRPGPNLTAAPPGLDDARPVTVSPGGACEAAFAGPAVFRFRIVLPKTARLTGGRVTVEASASAVVRLGGRELAAPGAGEAREVRLDAAQFGPGSDFEIPGLGFSDFARRDLQIEVAAGRDARAALRLAGRIDYQLPVESAAAYLTYVMTQA